MHLPHGFYQEYLESSSQDHSETLVKLKVSLQHFTLGANSTLINRTIRESKIRERTKGLVVGIERNGEHILNPESDILLAQNDQVWVVGNEKRILLLAKEFIGS